MNIENRNIFFLFTGNLFDISDVYMVEYVFMINTNCRIEDV